MNWIVLSALLLASDPEFTMDAQPGDTVRAQIFERTIGDAATQIATLLGGDDLNETPYSADGNIRFVVRSGRPNPTEVVLYVADASSPGGDVFCKLSGIDGGVTNNGERALRWCRTFLDKPLNVQIGRID